MDKRFQLIRSYLTNHRLVLLTAFVVGISALVLFKYPSSQNDIAINNPVPTQIVEPTTTLPVIETTIPTTVQTTVVTTTTLPDLSGVDFVALARSAYGKCGEYHDLAIKVGWPEEEWPRLQEVIWRESRCTTEAWNGHDAGLTQINQIHSKWLLDFGWSHPNDMFDPEKNLTFALRLWETSGWKPWRFSGTTWGD